MTSDYPKRETIAYYWPVWASPSTHTGALTEANTREVFAIPFRQFHSYMVSGKPPAPEAEVIPKPVTAPRARSRAT